MSLPIQPAAYDPNVCVVEGHRSTGNAADFCIRHQRTRTAALGHALRHTGLVIAKDLSGGVDRLVQACHAVARARRA